MEFFHKKWLKVGSGMRERGRRQDGKGEGALLGKPGCNGKRHARKSGFQ